MALLELKGFGVGHGATQLAGIDLSIEPATMLAVVGHPTAVNPDLRLRAVARSYDWPVLDLN